ncbi:MAG: hypothetical protein ACREHC_06750, partial [Candidatus Levyibacteriota bacterium]
MSKKVIYCAWCWKPKIRNPKYFYSSTICKIHLVQLRQGSIKNEIAKCEVARMPKQEVLILYCYS